MAIAESPGWLNIVNATIPDFIRKVADNTLRSRMLLNMMEQKGRVTFGHAGTKYNGKVRFKRQNITPYASDDTLIFSRVNRYQQWELPNDRAYINTQSLGDTDIKQNRGDAAIIKLWDDAAKSLMSEMRQGFCTAMYKDGYASGNGKDIMGIESCLGVAATPVVAAPGFVQPNDTYADLSTALGTYGGSWSNGTWPQGSGDEQYSFWSPILVDYTSPVADAYTASQRTWKNTCVEAIRNLTTYTRVADAEEGMMDLLLLEGTLFKQYKDAQENFKQITYLSGEALAMRNMGFDTMSQDGAIISTEFAIPANTGYAFNTSMMEIKSLNDELFASWGPIFDENTLSWRWIVQFQGNMELNPRFMGKLYNYTATAS